MTTSTVSNALRPPHIKPTFGFLMVIWLAWCYTLYRQLSLLWCSPVSIQPLPLPFPSLGLTEKQTIRTLQSKQQQQLSITDNTSKHAKGSNPWVIFYNIYIPVDKDSQTNAFRVIDEQLQQIRQSYAAKHSTNTLQLYYVTIGHNLTDHQWIQERCNCFVCTHVRHETSGFEEVTLQPLYEYCVQQPEHRVIYLHSKGTFHPSHGAERWRRAMTEAVTSRHCLHDDIPSQCHVCGLTFSPVWTPLYPGNMWVGACSHIRLLIPPRDFAERMTKFTDNLPLYHFHYELYNASLPDHMGTERWAMEVWVTSHPTLTACDVSNPPFFRRSPNTQLESAVVAPRTTIKEPVFHLSESKKQLVLGNTTLRDSEYFLLPGLLHKYTMLYGAVPPRDSWIWSWFPDGGRWYNLFQHQVYSNALRDPLDITIR
jgi:hypothetical protein